ncbi:MAG: putative mannose-phosphate guanylyltransferase [Acidimicrobiaceae bacterium]|nr:putative mannose-phosphate guanylyltransferase [Acidimicrobiaceae bacterium]
MIAVVLVGGIGTRLRPLTYALPKPMLPVVERPMIARVVEWLASHDVTTAVLSLGYQPDAFVDAFPDGSWAGVELRYAVEPEPLDTAGAIRFAACEAGVERETLVVVNGDVLTDLDLRALVAFHGEKGGEATISLTPVEDPSAYGVVPTDVSGRVLAFIEKPAREAAPTNHVNAGTYVFEPSVISRIATGRRVSVEREIFPGIVERGALFALDSASYWLDTGTPERYLRAQIDVLSGLRPDVSLPECAQREPGVYFAPGSSVDGDISGCAFVGRDASVDAGALIEDAVIGASAHVAAGARVIHSVLLPGAVIREGAVVEHSVVGPSSIVGTGAAITGGSVVGAAALVPDGTLLDSAQLPV